MTRSSARMRGPAGRTSARSERRSRSTAVAPTACPTSSCRWEWDIGADGSYEYVSDMPLARHTFAAPFDGLVALRVTDAAGESALASTVGHASADGDEIAAADDNCPMTDNRDQADYDEDGVGDVCDPAPGYPQHDVGGGSDSGTPVAHGARAWHGADLRLLARRGLRVTPWRSRRAPTS